MSMNNSSLSVFGGLLRGLQEAQQRPRSEHAPNFSNFLARKLWGGIYQKVPEPEPETEQQGDNEYAQKMLLRRFGHLLRALVVKKQQRLRDEHLAGAARLHQHIAEAEQQEETERAQKLLQRLQWHEQEAAQLAHDIQQHSICSICN